MANLFQIDNDFFGAMAHLRIGGSGPSSPASSVAPSSRFAPSIRSDVDDWGPQADDSDLDLAETVAERVLSGCTIATFEEACEFYAKHGFDLEDYMYCVHQVRSVEPNRSFDGIRVQIMILLDAEMDKGYGNVRLTQEAVEVLSRFLYDRREDYCDFHGMTYAQVFSEVKHDFFWGCLYFLYDM